ncbi:carbohydrate-binding module family 13 protein [Tulasnella calospora MUT 4182]|uniref:Carbohydrate-binding module family 13 protein n=1 Tax=Tulasnella calospora MUT 4182 TaxID=1051891 RepID=A0A0C3KB94_9AGAM|nr:carbohydrate-binding module family 13 protein [Tulasnella calospora MUT 4182]
MTIQNGVYRLKNLKSGTYLDNSEKNRETIHGWDSRPGSGNQEWEVRKQDDSYTIRNVSSRRYVHASSGSNGTRVKAEDTESRWEIRDASDNTYNIFLKGSQGVIDLDNGNDDKGTAINIWGRTDARQQRWKFEKVRDLGGDHSGERRDTPGGQQPLPQPGGGGGGGGSAGRYQGDVPAGRYWIRNAHSGTAMDLSGSNANDGAAIIGYQVTQGDNQQWELEPGVQGYRIRNNATGTYLSLRDGEQPADGVLPTGNRNSKTEWDVRGDQNGYTLKIPGTNFVLDLAQGSAQDGAKICVWTSSGANNQRWLLVRA